MNQSIQRAFIVLHMTLGCVIFIGSADTFLTAMARPAWGLVAFSGAEALACILFLIPHTMRFGGLLLGAILLVALVLHGFQGEFLAPLLVYVAGVLFVVVHGSAYRIRRDGQLHAA